MSDASLAPAANRLVQLINRKGALGMLVELRIAPRRFGHAPVLVGQNAGEGVQNARREAGPLSSVSARISRSMSAPAAQPYTVR